MTELTTLDAIGTVNFEVQSDDKYALVTVEPTATRRSSIINDDVFFKRDNRVVPGDSPVDVLSHPHPTSDKQSASSKEKRRRRAAPRGLLCCCALLCAILLLLGVIVAIAVPLSLRRSPGSVADITTVSTSTTAITTTRIPSTNLVRNGDGETGPCQAGNGVTRPTGWEYNGTITQVYYNNTYADQMYTDPGPSDRGHCYFFGQRPASVTSMWQYVNLTGYVNPALIDNQTVFYNFSAWLGGYSSQRDHAQAALTFISHTGQQLGSPVTLGPVTNIDRSNVTCLLFRQASGLVPVGARSFLVFVTITLFHGVTADGDADNIGVYLYQ